MRATANLIEIEQVTHTFTGNEQSISALSGISGTVKQGEFLAIIGSNGSGKSTLAKHLNALLLPTEGKVTIDGMDTRNAALLWNVRQMIGMVFQNPDNQIVAALVEEDVAFGPENLGLAPETIKARVDEALEMVKMTEYRKQAPHLLSGGQKQRVAIAGAIAMRPKCLVLDEATAMLDPVGRREVLETIIKLNRCEGMTIVLITHFMEEAAEADRIWVMQNGNKLMDGTPSEIFAKADELKQINLETTTTATLADQLRKREYLIPSGIYKPQQLAGELCQLK